MRRAAGSDRPAVPGIRVKVDSVRVHGDARGAAFEPLDAVGLRGQANVHAVVTVPGAVRGNHVHRRRTEVLAVMGPALVRLRDGEETADIDVPAGGVTRFEIPPGVAHAVKHTGTRPGVLVAFADRPHDPEDPDTEPVALLEPDDG